MRGRLLLLPAILLVSLPARAAVIPVTTTADTIAVDGLCSLREAVLAANADATTGDCTAGSGADVVSLGVGTYGLSIAGFGEDATATGDLDVTTDITFQGAGVDLTIVDGTGLGDRLFDAFMPGGELTLVDMTLEDGAVVGSGGCVRATDDLEITRTAIRRCTATASGGAISAVPLLNLTDVSVEDGTAFGGWGGGVAFGLGGGGTFERTTITGCSAHFDGAGINVNAGVLTLAETTVSGNTITSGARSGAGVHLQTGGFLWITDSTFDGNQGAGFGGGIAISEGTADIRNSTISGNAAGQGGGLSAGTEFTTGTGILRNVTVADNTATVSAGGVMVGGGSSGVALLNSIVGDNTAPAGPDCTGAISSGGYTLIEDATDCLFTPGTGDQVGVDPRLATLDDNAGATRTHALLPGSPALDTGFVGTPGSGGQACEASDQRGATRPVNLVCDLGSFEAPAGGVTTTTTTTTTTTSTTTTTTTTSSTTTTSLTTTTTSTTSTTTLPAECGGSFTTASSAVVTPILDVGVATSTIVVSGAGSWLLDLDVATDIVHTYNEDLVVTLTSPAGTVVTLTSANGGGADDVYAGTRWDDDADPDGALPYATNDGLATDHAYGSSVLASPLVPEEALGAFIGEDPNGTWTLTIADTFGGDVGTLNTWSLDLRALAGPPVTQTSSMQNTTPTPLPDMALTSSTIDVSGATGLVLDVNVRTDLLHESNEHVDMTLTSPSGIVVTLTTDNGEAFADVFDGTVWDDAADPDGTAPYATNAGVVTDHPYAAATATPLVPEEALAAFLGEDPNGTWTLAIQDDTPGGTGSLDAWQLDFTLFCAPTTTSTTTATTSTSTTTSTTVTTILATTTTTTVLAATTTTVTVTVTSTTAVTTSTLPAPLCAGTGTLQNAALVWRKPAGAAGGARVALTGTIDVPALGASTLQPATHGAQLLLEDLGGTGSLLALTSPNGIPPGGPGTGCGKRDGWRGATYRNKSDAVDPPACPDGSAQGLHLLTLKDRRAKDKGIRLVAKVRSSGMTAPTGPVRATIVLGGADAGRAGECAVHTFASCKANAGGIVCK